MRTMNSHCSIIIFKETAPISLVQYNRMCKICNISIVSAVYLCKRTMQNKQRLELADYEAENLARLQKMFSRKWEFIFMQAEAQAK